MKKTILPILMFVLSTFDTQAQCPEEITTKVLLLGDSWAFFMDNDHTINNVFDQWGHTHFEYYTNNDLSINGARTEDFLEEERLLEIKNQLLDQSSIEVVHLSIGGNDFLGDWNVSMSDAEIDDLAEGIIDNIRAITDFIKDIRPNIQIVYSGYMYPNFEENIEELAPFQSTHIFYDTWEDMGFPNFMELNTAMNYFLDHVEGLTDSDDRITFLNVPALMQHHYGQEMPLDVDPGGTYPALFQPLPFGDETYPSPQVSMRDYSLLIDCFHLSVEGYEVMMNYQAQKFYHKHLMDDLILYPSDNEDENGSVFEDGSISNVLGVGVSMGNEQQIQLTFDTELLADTVILAASIFLHRDSVLNNNPVGTTISLSMKNGAFEDNFELESMDFASPGDIMGEACVFGIEEDGNWIRIDLPETFIPLLQNETRTQFRLSTSEGTEEVVYFSGNENEEFAPVLNINYRGDLASVPTVEKEDEFILFPNPAKNSVTILSNEIIEEVTLSDLNGKIITTIVQPENNIIPIEALPNGAYLVKIRTNHTLSVKKIIKN